MQTSWKSIITVAALLASSVALAADPAPATQTSNIAAPAAQQQAPAASSKTPQRNFYEVLEDLMGDFEYDLKNGQVTGLKNTAIRNIALSENVPPSFKSHLELVLTEKMLKTTKTRVVQCLPCKAKRTTLNGDQVVITSPETNPVELSRIAKLAGIETFMDIAFSYQPSGMVLSMYLVEPEAGAILWSRSYNSETSRAAAARRGVDYAQIDDARKQNEYTPTLQYRATAFYMFEPNPGGATGCIGAGFRLVERYDNRRKEVGFELDYLKDSSSFVSQTTSTSTDINYFAGFNLTLLFMHSWNLIGEEENFNLVRGNIFVGIGGTFASGSTPSGSTTATVLGGLVRAGYEWRLAKHWAVSANVGYRPKATPFLSTGTATTAFSGAEFGVGISGLF